MKPDQITIRIKQFNCMIDESEALINNFAKQQCLLFSDFIRKNYVEQFDGNYQENGNHKAKVISKEEVYEKFLLTQ